MRLSSNDRGIRVTLGQLLFACVTTVFAAPVFDGDRDGIPDERDLCLFTAPGEAVMANGCARTGDADQDGIDDSIDRCPRSPSGAMTGSDGCSLDQDIDGVADGIDRCPNTQLGYMVDSLGCTSGQTPIAVAPRAGAQRAAITVPPAISPPPAQTSSAPLQTHALPERRAATAAPQSPDRRGALGSAAESAPVVARPPRLAVQSGIDTNEPLRVEFRRYSALLDDEAQAALQTFAVRVAPLLKSSSDSYVVVTGAVSDQEVGAAAHRLGVGRAMTIKAFLRSVGIDGDRIRTPQGAEQRSDSVGSADVRLSGT